MSIAQFTLLMKGTKHVRELARNLFGSQTNIFKITLHMTVDKLAFSLQSVKSSEKRKRKAVGKMKAAVVAVLFALILVLGVDSASVSLSNSKLTLNGNAHIQFYGPREEIWAGLSDGHRYPILNSGDLIALRVAATSGSLSQRWLYCSTSYCSYTTCHGTHMYSSSWGSCSSYMIFKIIAMGKMDGQPINSGDTVTLMNKAYGYTSSYHIRCYVSQSSACRMSSTTSSMTGNSWLYYSYTTFQIFSRSAVDGRPIQYGDVVGLKFSFGGYLAWMYRSGSRFYSKNCSYNNKYSCAAKNAAPGFIIFKKL